MSALEAQAARPSRAVSIAFWLLCVLAAPAPALTAGFFLLGWVDGSVRAWNLPHWLSALAIAFGIPVLAWVLRRRGRRMLALLLLSPLAAAVLIAGLMLGLFLSSGGHWQ
jgi:hypothetical protein